MGKVRGGAMTGQSRSRISTAVGQAGSRGCVYLHRWEGFSGHAPVSRPSCTPRALKHQPLIFIDFRNDRRADFRSKIKGRSASLNSRVLFD
jgi:hypothetical protein